MILVLAALATAAPFECPPAATVIVTFETMNMIPILSTVTSALESRSAALTGSSNHMTIAVTNINGNHLSLLFGSDAGGLSFIDNPSPTKLANNAFNQYAFPTE